MEPQNQQVKPRQLDKKALPPPKNPFFLHNWLHFVFGLVVILLVISGILFLKTVYVPIAQAPTEQQGFTGSTLTDKILDDKDVQDILNQFADHKTYIEFGEIGANAILQDSVNRSNGDLKERIKNAQQALQNKINEGVGDAPEARSLAFVHSKLCVAESIVYKSIKNILERCDIEDAYPVDVEWNSKADDITASAQVMPYFMMGIAYLLDADSERAEYYFSQIRAHEDVIVGQYSDQAYKTVGAEYKEIIDKLNKIESIDTSTWKTYRNDEYGFQLKYPDTWVVESISNGVELKSIESNSFFAILENSNSSDLSLDEWFRETTLIGGRPTVKASAQLVTINGIHAYRLDTDLEPPNPYFEIVGIANSKRRIFTLHAHREIIEDASSLNQILSTFRFVDIDDSLKPADAEDPVAGACWASGSGNIASLQLSPLPLDNIPVPRCFAVKANQKLQIINNGTATITVSLGRLQMTVEAGGSQTDSQTFGSYLAVGVHSMKVSPDGVVGVPAIWLQ